MRTLVVNAFRMAQQRTGIGRYIEFVAQQWSRMKIPFDRVVLMSPKNIEMSGFDRVTSVEVKVFGGQYPAAIWEQVCFHRAAKGAAILFCPSYICPLLHRGRMVLANHGFYEALPGEFSWFTRLRATTLQRYSAKCAERVIANSLATKADLVRFFGIPPEKIDTIYPAAHDYYFQRHDPAAIKEEVIRALGKEVPYVIFVGKLAKRRHVPNLIEAFAIVRRQHNLPHALLIVGPNTTNVPIAEIAQQHGVGDVRRRGCVRPAHHLRRDLLYHVRGYGQRCRCVDGEAPDIGRGRRRCGAGHADSVSRRFGRGTFDVLAGWGSPSQVCRTGP